MFNIRGMGLGHSQASGKQSVQKMLKEISLDKEETWLVVWNHGILCFHIYIYTYIYIYIGNVIIPTDEFIFFRGLAQPPTS